MVLALAFFTIHTEPDLRHEVLNHLVETVELAGVAGDDAARYTAVSQLIHSAESSADNGHRLQAMGALMLLFINGAVTPADLTSITNERMFQEAILALAPRLWRGGCPRHEDVQALAFACGLLRKEALSVRLPAPILSKLTSQVSAMMLMA